MNKTLKKKKITNIVSGILLCGLIFTFSTSSFEVNANEILRDPSGYYKIAFKDRTNLSNVMRRVLGRNYYGIKNITGYTKFNNNYIPFSFDAGNFFEEGYIEGHKVEDYYKKYFSNYIEISEKLQSARDIRETKIIESKELSYLREGVRADGTKFEERNEIANINSFISENNIETLNKVMERYNNPDRFMSNNFYVSSISLVGDYDQFSNIDRRLRRNIDFKNESITYKLDLKREEIKDRQFESQNQKIDEVIKEVYYLQPIMNYSLEHSTSDL